MYCMIGYILLMNFQDDSMGSPIFGRLLLGVNLWVCVGKRRGKRLGKHMKKTELERLQIFSTLW